MKSFLTFFVYIYILWILYNDYSCINCCCVTNTSKVSGIKTFLVSWFCGQDFEQDTGGTTHFCCMTGAPPGVAPMSGDRWNGYTWLGLCVWGLGTGSLQVTACFLSPLCLLGLQYPKDVFTCMWGAWAGMAGTAGVCCTSISVMCVAWASSQHGGLKRTSLLKWQLVFPEVAFQEASGGSFKTS